MFLTRLAFKNLARHKNRTLITSIIIAFAIFFYILMDSLVGGMTEMSYSTLINYEIGHLQVADRQYWAEEEKLKLENLFTVDEQMMKSIQSIPGYIGSSPELAFSARLNNGSDELPVIGKGVRLEDFQTVFALADQFVEGSFFTPGEEQAVLGKRLAELMELEVGDYLILVVKDKNETFNTIEAQISGLAHTSNPNVNQNIVYLPLDLAQQTLNVGEQVSKVVIRMEKAHTASRVAAELEKKLSAGGDARLGVYPWNELEAVSFVEAQKIENQVILAIILSIAAIAIINTVILAALERREEIGMMKAMGLRNSEVVYVFVLESTGIGVLGGIIGVLMGVGGVWLMNTYGIDFERLYGMDLASFGMPVIGKVYGVWNPFSFAKVVAFGIIVSFISSVFPAYWAADKDPVQTIYHR
ncbi:MAG TPA: ABC transporter permease [Firmicutes bacterium]|nr:ABC transporter permease [Bacillota bacterium]